MIDMNAQTIDGAFEDDFLEYIDHYYTGRLNWRYGHVSNGKQDTTKFFYGACFDGGWSIDDCPITEWIKIKAEQVFEMVIEEVEDNYVNGHTFELEGTTHIDTHVTNINSEYLKNPTYTLLFMPNFYGTETMGGFEFEDNLIDYKPGRFILFPSMIKHRGLATSSKSYMRMTIAWKNCTIAFNSA